MITSQTVSVIIIFWNAEPFLAEAVASVVAQSHPDWELLLVDDGSTDGSTEIAKQLIASDPERMRYLEHPGHANRGMSASRNLGIAHARGAYLAFLDADDVWLPDKLSQQVTLLEEHPEAALVFGPTEWWYSWSGRAEDQGRDLIAPLGVPAGTLLPPPLLVSRLLRQEGLSPCTCSLLVRREIVEQVGGFEERFRGLYEDQAFVAKICLMAPVYASSTCSCRYRQHPNSACAVADRAGQTRLARHTFLNWLNAYMSAQGLTDAELRQVLEQELWPHRHPYISSVVGGARYAARQFGRR
jgi:glycosyltransferase involved in cell wall biosynthesis